MMAIATSADVALEVRQHPLNALVTPENKEKSERFATFPCTFATQVD